MIVRINGVILEEKEQLLQPSSVTGLMKKERSGLIKAALPFGTKAVFGIALATLAIDMMLGSGGSITAAAAGTQQISAAFEPVKNLLIDVADPLCYVMFVWGCIECIIGRAASGINRMKYAAIGYIAINWIPVVMAVIRGAAPN